MIKKIVVEFTVFTFIVALISIVVTGFLAIVYFLTAYWFIGFRELFIPVTFAIVFVILEAYILCMIIKANMNRPDEIDEIKSYLKNTEGLQ